MEWGVGEGWFHTFLTNGWLITCISCSCSFFFLGFWCVVIKFNNALMLAFIKYVFIFRVGFKIRSHAFLTNEWFGFLISVFWSSSIMHWCLYCIYSYLEWDSRFDFNTFSLMGVLGFWFLSFYQVHQCTDVCIYIV